MKLRRLTWYTVGLARPRAPPCVTPGSPRAIWWTSSTVAGRDASVMGGCYVDRTLDDPDGTCRHRRLGFGHGGRAAGGPGDRPQGPARRGRCIRVAGPRTLGQGRGRRRREAVELRAALCRQIGRAHV